MDPRRDHRQRFGVWGGHPPKRDGVDDFVVLERAAELGGTWRDNTYPGCACDVESHLYSFSFALEPGWTWRFSRQPEIWRYLQRCARDFGLMPHIRFHHHVQSATWDEDARHWRIETSHGRLPRRFSQARPLSEAVVPDLRASSVRRQGFHSARWDHEYDLTGRRGR